jgi:ribosomal protein L25 (general stress protein Ctc)
MSDAIFTLNAEVRSDLGKGASRRLRHADKVPAIIYGGHQPALSITLDHSKLLKAQSFEAFYSHILTINVGGEEVKAIVKDESKVEAIAKAALSLESEDDFTAFLDAMQSMVATVDASEMFVEKGASVQEETTVKESAVAKLLKAKQVTK